MWWMNLSLKMTSVANDTIPRAVAYFLKWVLGRSFHLITLRGDSPSSTSMSEDQLNDASVPLPEDAVALVELSWQNLI